MATPQRDAPRRRRALAIRPAAGGSAATRCAPTEHRSEHRGDSIEDKLAAAKNQLIARLSSEIRPERRSLLSRGDLAKIVDAAVQAYFVRHAIDANPLARRDLVTDDPAGRC